MAAAAPNPQLVHSQGHTSSNYSIQSQISSNRISDTTQGTSHSTLFTPSQSTSSILPASVSANGPPPFRTNDVTATDNIMNSVADASSSLFQICVALKHRLMGVPGFDATLLLEEEVADDDTDPVTLLWRTFRRGDPLVLICNAIPRPKPIVLHPDIKADKRGKAATMQFLKACIEDLGFSPEDLFILNDLFGDDTTGFVKVAKVVNRIIGELVSRGFVEDVRNTAPDFDMSVQAKAKRTQRQHIIAELVTTERTYVQHLELLQAFKQLVESRGIIPGDAVHDIFLNLNALLDFQRRFLIRVEQTNAMPEDQQNWGGLFLLYSDAFKVYEPYIANQRKCEKMVVNEFPKLKEAGGSVEMRQMVESSTSLYGFLMKPFQRLSKYPLLLDDLYKKGDLDPERKEELLRGKEVATSVLSRTNDIIDAEEKAEAVQDLKNRVEDWKGHTISSFGQLLLHGSYTVLKSENLTSGKDTERQYHVYLFQHILLCCKNIDLNKPKNKLSNRNLVDSRGKPKLQLKGRIFMQNVTDLVSLSKPGSYTCQIFWKGDPSIENFVIRFTTDDQLRKWTEHLEAQRKAFAKGMAEQRASNESRGPSATEFAYMQNQPPLTNPYGNAIGEDDEDEDSSSYGPWSTQNGLQQRSDVIQSRNGSASSLRSRSTTGESVAPSHLSVVGSRAPPPRISPGVMSQQALTLRTRELQQAARSPGSEPQMDSYFSPIGDSPASGSRTSASSSMYPFPRQAVPLNGYHEEGHSSARFTAPAMPRQPSGSPIGGPTNGYGPPGRGPGSRPSFPSVNTMHSAASQQGSGPARNRSASSPDIHNAQRLAMRSGNQPPVPEMPANFHNHVQAVNRSQNNSPSLVNGLPPGAGRVSPTSMRQRQGSYPEQAPVDHMWAGQATGAAAPRSLVRAATSQQSYPAPFPPGTGYSPDSSNVPVPRPQSSATPSQLKVRVHCPIAGQTLTLVVPTTITYQSLKDRIDAKLQRSTNLSLGDRGPREFQVKLKYLDDEDYVSIQSDEDVQIAFETWREQQGEGIGGMGEIELFCQR